MAPLIRLLALFALALTTAVLASPHVPRNAYNHAHRAIAPVPAPNNGLPSSPDIALPRRKRSLNKRCVPRPANSTTSALPTSTAPINVAPVPSLTSSPSPSPSPSSAADTTSSTSSYVPPPSPTSQAASPSPTTPTPTPSPSPSPTTSSTAAPAQTSSSSTTGEPSYMTGTQSGQGTFFSDGLGACGFTNTDSQYIVAVAESLFDTYPGYDGVNPNTNPVCGKSITANYQGKSVTVTVTDRCTGCATTDLDFSIAAFDSIAAASVGRIDMSWFWT